MGDGGHGHVGVAGGAACSRAYHAAAGNGRVPVAVDRRLADGAGVVPIGGSIPPLAGHHLLVRTFLNALAADEAHGGRDGVAPLQPARCGRGVALPAVLAGVRRKIALLVANRLM